ncbi:MAG: hypothetical protein MZW92_71870 [Comamonadaceae bacterium]|nr:hypothetical protein [Comamonadaceae bacterium]
MEKHGTYTIHYLSGIQDYKLLYARTITPKGEKIDLQPVDIIEKSIAKEWKAKLIGSQTRFSPAGTEEEIQYSWELRTPFFNMVERWKFQDDIPVKLSEVTYKPASWSDYGYVGQNIKGKPEIRENDTDRSLTVIRRDVPAFQAEPYFLP